MFIMPIGFTRLYLYLLSTVEHILHGTAPSKLNHHHHHHRSCCRRHDDDDDDNDDGDDDHDDDEGNNVNHFLSI